MTRPNESPPLLDRGGAQSKKARKTKKNEEVPECVPGVAPAEKTRRWTSVEDCCSKRRTIVVVVVVVVMVVVRLLPPRVVECC
eukprot:SAG22_NODE_1271_length_4929_cov_4.159420_3_plen_83_part_00